MRPIIVLGFLLCLSARADAGGIVVKLESGDEPVTLKKVKELRGKNELRNDWVWVAYEGFAPLQRPHKDSPPSGAPSLKFMAMVNNLYEHQFGGVYYLVALGDINEGNVKILGWVPKNYMVLDNRAKRDSYSKLLHQAMIVNTTRFLKEETVVEKLVQPPPMLLGPDPKAKANPPFRLFNVYFVYGDSHPRTNEKEEEQGYLLLGSRTSINEETASEAILGWVNKNRIISWKSREAIKWDTNSKRNEAVVTYEKEDEAMKAIRNEKAKMVTSEILVSDQPPAWSHSRMRYPILAIKTDEKTGKDVTELSVKGNILRKIGLVGGFVNEKGEQASTAEELDLLDKTLENQQTEANNLEILFVVDDSESMDAWFPQTAETIKELIKSVSSKDRTLRIGLTYYSDVAFGERGTLDQLKKAVITSGELSDANSDKVKKLLDELPAHKTRPGYDPPEQVFLGLRMGIDDARFSVFSRKIVILIGDTGDHNLNADGTFNNERGIVKWLTPKGQTPIEFYALQVSERIGDDQRTFKNQTEKIVELFKDATEKAKKQRPAGYFYLTQKAQLKQVILGRFKELQEDAKNIQNQMTSIRMGRFDLIDKLDPEFVENLKQKIGEKQLDRFKKSKGAQLFSDAFVWEKNSKGQKQTCGEVLVNKAELEAIRKMLKDLLFGNPDAGHVPTPVEIGKLLVKLQEGTHGKDYKPQDDPTIENSMKVKYGFKFRSKLLKMTVEEYKQELGEDLANVRRLRLELKKKYYLIDDILEKKKHEYGKKDENDSVGWHRVREIKPTTSGEFDRSHYLHSKEVLYYWLDYDKEWP